jgi:hypothetical protein
MMKVRGFTRALSSAMAPLVSLCYFSFELIQAVIGQWDNGFEIPMCDELRPLVTTNMIRHGTKAQIHNRTSKRTDIGGAGMD